MVVPDTQAVRECSVGIQLPKHFAWVLIDPTKYWIYHNISFPHDEMNAFLTPTPPCFQAQITNTLAPEACLHLRPPFPIPCIVMN